MGLQCPYNVNFNKQRINTVTHANQSITLSTGRVVYHRPALNGATEAYLMNGECMTNLEWKEYCVITAPKEAPKKRTWAQIKADKNKV